MSRGKHHRGASRAPSPAGQAQAPAAPPPVPPRARIGAMAAIGVALVIVTFAAFGGLLSSGFVNYDDPVYVTENAHVQRGLTGESVAWAFRTTEAANWHPLTWLSHMLDVQLFGLEAGKHHLTSLLLHALNTLLLFFLLVRMTGALWRSAFVAALFALHPLHVQSVAWIAERKDVLSTLLWLLTLGAWGAYLKSKKTGPYALAMAFFALGLMAKPMLVTLPFTLLLLDYWPLGRLVLPLRGRSGALKELLWEKAPLFALSAASCIVTAIVQRSGGAVVALEHLGFGSRLANAALAYVGYLGKTLWPASLAVFYPHPRARLALAAAGGAALLLLGVTVMAFRLGKRAPFLVWGWLWYLGTLVPVIGLVQVGDHAMADRYTYIPLIGIFVAIAWGLAALVRERRALRHAVAVAALASLAALFLVTRIQSGYWSDSKALFEHALAVTSDNYLAHNQLGVALEGENRHPEAVEHYRQALRIRPNYAQAMDNLGLDLAKMNRGAEALEYLQQAVRINPDSADAQYNLGIALAAAGRLDEAVEHYRRALGIKPDHVQAMNNLGVALGNMDRLPEAIECLRHAVRLQPDFADAHYNLGLALDDTGRLDEAVEHYRRVLGIKPDHVQAMNYLGVALGKMNRLPEAIECLQNAVRIHPDFADAQYNLGLALAYTGRLDEAAERFREAVRIKPDSADAHFQLGSILARQRHPEEAREQFQQALRIAPDHAQARAALEHLPGK